MQPSRKTQNDAPRVVGKNGEKDQVGGKKKKEKKNAPGNKTWGCHRCFFVTSLWVGKGRNGETQPIRGSQLKRRVIVSDINQ